MRQLRHPLRHPSDVDRYLLDLGDKTRDKVRAIMEGGGTYWRNRVREDSEVRQTVARFAEVWGAGQPTAGGWVLGGGQWWAVMGRGWARGTPLAFGLQ